MPTARITKDTKMAGCADMKQNLSTVSGGRNKMMKLFVDDLRECPEGFEVARTYKEAIDFLENNEVAELALDHDLGEIKHSGYSVMLWLEERANNGLPIPKKITCHSGNPVGKQRIEQVISKLNL